MDLSNLKPDEGARSNRKRVGRGPGSGKGKTSGKGHKGQQARSGYSRNYGFEGGQIPLHRRLPKRGFYQGDRFPRAAINLDQIDGAFEAGAEISQDTLVAAGLVRNLRGGVKILARGEVTKNFVLKVEAISEGARAKIEAAGGSIELVGPAAVKAAATAEAAPAAAKEAPAPAAAETPSGEEE